MSSPHLPDEQIALYALGAVGGKERSDLEQHLKGCAHCRARVKETSVIVNLLPRAVEPMEPSPEMKRKLFARVDADLAKAAGSGAQTGTDMPYGAGLRRLASRRTLAFTLILVAVLVVIGFFASPFAAQINQQREIAAILNNPNAQTRMIAGTKDAPDAHGRLVAAPDGTQAVLVVDGLKPLPADKTYEFWLIRGAQPFPAGLFGVGANGSSTLLITAAQSINTFDKLGVTIEQSAGEQTPKGTLVLQQGF